MMTPAIINIAVWVFVSISQQMKDCRDWKTFNRCRGNVYLLIYQTHRAPVPMLYAHSPFPPCDSQSLGGSCARRPTLVGIVVPESILTVVLGEADGAAASLRFPRPDLVLTEPGAALAEAGLTLTGLALTGGLEQMEGWGADFSSAALAEFSSGCGGKSDKRGQRSAISVDS